MKSNAVRVLVRTAILLALCVVFQTLKSFSMYITGPLVNAVLVLAALSCGLPGGLAIAFLAPVAAWLIGATPVINAIPFMLPVIMVGNALLVLFAWLFRKKLLPVGLVLGCLCKGTFLWLTVWFVVMPFFGAEAPEKLKTAAKLSFSYPQFITAAAGCVIAWLVWQPLKKQLAKS